MDYRIKKPEPESYPVISLPSPDIYLPKFEHITRKVKLLEAEANAIAVTTQEKREEAVALGVKVSGLIKTLVKTKETLKDGGHLFIAVPNTIFFEIYLRKLLKKPHFREDMWEWHFCCFNPKSLRALLMRTGFKIEDVDSEFYLKRNKIEPFPNYLTQAFLRLTGINMCKTILVHAVKG